MFECCIIANHFFLFQKLTIKGGIRKERVKDITDTEE